MACEVFTLVRSQDPLVAMRFPRRTEATDTFRLHGPSPISLHPDCAGTAGASGAGAVSAGGTGKGGTDGGEGLSADSGPSDRSRFDGPMVKAHSGFSRDPASFTSKALDRGVSTAPTTD